MSDLGAGLLQVAALLVVLGVCYVPLGDYMARVFTSEKHWRVESAIYRLVRVDATSGQRWTSYAAGVLGFSFVSVVLLYLLQRLQPLLPLGFGRGVDGDTIPPAMAFNNAVSFVTNTNWQSYVPETVLGHTVQLVGLTVQNVVSAAVGMAVAVALIRGFVRSGTDRIGNFWVDLTRGVMRILLPLSFVAAILLVAMGVTMSLRSGVDVTGVDGAAHTLPLAPAASQEAIKELGTNGGGIFNANSAHPFENPNALSNVFEIFLLLVIPVCLTRTFGTMVGNPRQGTVLVSVMGALWAGLLAVAWFGRDAPERAGGAGRGRGHGGQGGPVRHPVVGAVRGVHHRHLDRRGQLAARQLHRRRRRGDAAEHAARRGRAGRGRDRALRDPGAGRDRGVPGRADGRAHAGVPGQEAGPGAGHRGRGVDPGDADAGAARRRAGDRAARHRSTR